LKEREAEEKRAQIRSELPYKEEQLKVMKRTALVMIASVLGVKDPVRVGSTDKLISLIKKYQYQKFPTGKKPPAKEPAKIKKAAPAPEKKPGKKKKK
jgi:hypothetical protein